VAGENCENQSEIVPVKNQPKHILPEFFAKGFLRSPPRRKAFEQKTEQGNSREPEIVLQVNGHVANLLLTLSA
jgi:hypothetical protein